MRVRVWVWVWVRVGVNKDVPIICSLAQPWPNVPVINILHSELLHATNLLLAMNKLSRLIFLLLAGSPFALYFLTHLGYMDLQGAEELYEDISVITTARISRTHKPPVTKPSSDEIIISQAPSNLSSMVN